MTTLIDFSDDGIGVLETALKAGSVVSLPTDTVYGLAVDPWSASGVANLRTLCGIADDTPLTLLIADPRQLRAFTAGTSVAEIEACREIWPGPVTVIFRRPVSLHIPAVGNGGFTALRVPDHRPLAGLVRNFGPLAVTSARVAEGGHAHNHSEAVDLLGDHLTVAVRGASQGVRSTIVDATDEPWAILRPGPLAAADIAHCGS